MTSSDLNTLGKMIHDYIPIGYGFCVFVIPIIGDTAKTQYISTIHRDDVIKLLSAWIEYSKQKKSG